MSFFFQIKNIFYANYYVLWQCGKVFFFFLIREAGVRDKEIITVKYLYPSLQKLTTIIYKMNLKKNVHDLW